MPLYLCQSGLGHAEPWRQGISVYAAPHNHSNDVSGGSSSSGDHAPAVIRRIRHAEVVLVDDICISHGRYWLRLRWPGHRGGFAGYIAVQKMTTTTTRTTRPAVSSDALTDQVVAPPTAGNAESYSNSTRDTNSANSEQGNERTRTSVSDVLEGSSTMRPDNDVVEGGTSSIGANETTSIQAGSNYLDINGADGSDLNDERVGKDNKNSGNVDVDIEEDEDEEDDEEEEEAGGEGAVTPSAADESMGEEAAVKARLPVVACLRTGLAFLSSNDMHLLPLYDDGLSPQVSALATSMSEVEAVASGGEDANHLFTTEPVFCRICREGLHDDADDEQPTAAEDNEAEDGGAIHHNRGGNAGQTNRRLIYRLSSRQSSNNDLDEEEEDETENVLIGTSQDDFLVSGGGAGRVDDPNSLFPESMVPVDADGSNSRRPAPFTGPLLPHPLYSPNQPALDNPLLAPCECSGSMAFVHYLCVEQWRCRSRHPEAQNGLSCETCGSRYSLPPPTSRPANVQQAMDQQQQAEDWLDAMPPHVMQALRNPHFMWQIGTAVVRRRWLRPLAPVLMSPIVALYCRARRLLKKRGVARRRWACSLCRRRARWKCVRCLRSYYCSRHCQNVAWHIIHKHVCYKPVRLWWSTVVYGALCLITFPGILRDPLMYDLGLLLMPFSFIVIGILAGGIATSLKKTFGLDLRGRMLELTVVLGTLWLTVVSWGLVQAFFGQTGACHGSLGRRLVVVDRKGVAAASLVLYWIQRLLLSPAQSYYLLWDRLAFNSGSLLQSILCLPSHPNTDEGEPPAGCFEYLPHANANFFVSTTSTDDEKEVSYIEEAPSKCAADVLLVWYLYVLAAGAYVASALYKQRERRQRRLQQQQMQQQQQHHRNHLRHHHHHHHRQVLQPRPHQD
ncbi:hypothetical protein ACA910_018998 [Epithemia clementina (nom. ined.)]